MVRTKQNSNLVTKTEYAGLVKAYDHFNRALFDGMLPPCLITFQRKAGSSGYYSHDRFAHRGDQTRTAEIALNPMGFVGQSDKGILGSLVHEMTHLWQHHFGDPGRGRYHNHEWADKMEALGLMPSDTGKPGGRRTGQRMSDYTLPGGPFDRAADALLKGGWRANWQDPTKANGRGPQPKSKVKYTCPGCAQNAWAKPEASLVCGFCTLPMPPAEAPS
jgi:hypothetical protein